MVAEVFGQDIHVPHAVEHRQYHGLGADRPRKIGQRCLELKTLHREQNGVIGLRDPVRSDELWVQRRVPMGTDNAQPLPTQLFGAGGPD
jgi:hypothetical protein